MPYGGSSDCETPLFHCFAEMTSPSCPSDSVHDPGEPAYCTGFGDDDCALYSVSGADLLDVACADADSDNDGYYGICGQDCDDSNSNVYPGHSTNCANYDSNCDGFVDSSTPDCHNEPALSLTSPTTLEVQGTSFNLEVSTRYKADCVYYVGDNAVSGDDAYMYGRNDAIPMNNFYDSGGVHKTSQLVTQAAGTTKAYTIYCRTPRYSSPPQPSDHPYPSDLVSSCNLVESGDTGSSTA